MIADVAALVTITATVFGLMAGMKLSPAMGTVVLSLAPIVLGVGRSHSGCLGRVIRMGFVVIVLPIVALSDVYEVGDVEGELRTSVAVGLLVILVWLAAIYALANGAGGRRMAQFVKVVPLLLMIVGLGSAAGLPATLLVGFLAAVVALRLASQSHQLKRLAGASIEKSSSGAFEIGAAGLSVVVMALLTEAPNGVEGVSLVGWALAAVSLEVVVYFVFRGDLRDNSGVLCR